MKRFIIILLIIVFGMSNTSILYGQNVRCGTPTPHNYQTFERTKGLGNSNNTYAHLPICLNVYYHIVRRNDGSGGFEATRLHNISDVLNNAYAPLNIHYNTIGYEFIDNNYYYDIYNNNFRDELFDYHNQENAINIYIVGSYPGLRGIAQNIPSNAAIIVMEYVESMVTAHEVGHCLNLLHTHEIGYGRENVVRSGSNANCSYAGDKLCDTPADPLLQNKVNSNCIYTGNEVDALGFPYEPDTHNIMSYTLNSCRESFTSGQELRIRDAIASSPILQNIVGDTCHLSDIDGVDQMCNDVQETFSIDRVTGPYTWTCSSNLRIVTQNNNKVMVEAINNQTYGQAWLKVNYYMGQSKKNIWIGTYNGGVEEYTIRDDGGVLMVLPDDGTFDANPLQWRVNGQIVPNNTVNGLIEIDIDNYNDFCVDNLTEISVRRYCSSECGWSDFDSVYEPCDGDEWYRITLPYPNVSSTDLNIDFSKKPDGSNYHILLFNEKQEIKYDGYSGNVKKTINTLNLQNGIYFLKVISNGRVKTKHIIIHH